MLRTLGIAGLAVAISMAFAVSASAQLPVGAVEYYPSEGPVPVTNFDGTYTDSEGNTHAQQGFVGIYLEEWAGGPAIVACNGNETIARPDTGEPLQGYVWVGPSKAASNELVGTGDGTAGAGNGDSNNDDVYEEGETPCP
jgi:hypothetical protein